MEPYLLDVWGATGGKNSKDSYFKKMKFKLPYFRDYLSRQLFYFEAYGATSIQGRQLFKGGNYCFLYFLKFIVY